MHISQMVRDVELATYTVAALNSTRRSHADFACVGADDQVLINWILARMPFGGTLGFTDGDFILSDSIVVPANGINLVGISGETLIDGNGLPTGSHAIVISGFTDCSVRNMQVQTLAGGGNNCHCIFVENASHRLLIDEVNILQSDSDGVHIEGTVNVNDIHMYNLVVVSADGIGIWVDLTGAVDCSRLIIDGISVTNAGAGGIYLENCLYSIVSNSMVGSCTYGIWLGHSTNSSLCNNTIISGSEEGIYLYHSEYFSVTNCKCINNGTVGIYTDGGFGGDIAGNYCYMNGESGIEVPSTSDGLVIRGNYLHENGYHGIEIFNPDYVLVIGNYCNNNGTDAVGTYSGIYLTWTSHHCSVIGNYIWANHLVTAYTEDGIWLDGGANNCQIIGNHIYDLLGSGVVLTTDSDDCQIENNYIEACDDYGIEIAAATCNRTRCMNNKLIGNVTGQILDNGTNTQLPEIYTPVPNPDGNIGNHPALVLTDAADVTDRIPVRVPTEFQELVRAHAIVVPGGTGNMRRSVATDWGAICSEVYNLTSDAIAAGEVAVVINVLECVDISTALTAIAANDLVGVAFTREGTHIDDTVGANCYLLGIRFQYV